MKKINMKKDIDWSSNFPWQIFCAGCALLILSLAFQRYDIAITCAIPIVGSIFVFLRNCLLDIKNARKLAIHKECMEKRRKQRMQQIEEYEKNHPDWVPGGSAWDEIHFEE